MDILTFLYETIPGRFILKPFTSPRFSRACGRFLDSKYSSCFIRPFVRSNHIDVADYETDGIRSFNDFFSRKIKKGKRVVTMDAEKLIAPCDGLLSVWKVDQDTILPVQQSQ